MEVSEFLSKAIHGKMQVVLDIFFINHIINIFNMISKEVLRTTRHRHLSLDVGICVDVIMMMALSNSIYRSINITKILVIDKKPL